MFLLDKEMGCKRDYQMILSLGNALVFIAGLDMLEHTNTSHKSFEVPLELKGNAFLPEFLY